MSDQANGLRNWMKRSRDGSLAKDPAGKHRPAHEAVRGPHAGDSELVEAHERGASRSTFDAHMSDLDREIAQSSTEETAV